MIVKVASTVLAEWDPAARQRLTPQPSEVTVEVGSHAHDPAAIRVERATQ